VSADAPRVALRTLGCKVNRSESEALAEQLAALGVAVTEDESEGDAVVVNTCTVTGEADAKARKEVRRALQRTAGPVVVTGCLASLDAEGLRSLGDRVVVQPDRTQLPGTIASLLRPAGTPDPLPSRSGRVFRTRALVKVQDGCDNRCAYCIVPDARGGPRSVPSDSVVARVAALAAGGTAEVVLTGVNIGRYSDGPAAPDLATLIERIAATGIRRIRVSSIEPPDLTPRLLEALAAAPAVVPHLHVPLQSGCDRTLAAMGRRYTAAGYAEALGRARLMLPGLAVTTDVIAGFPGETDADFDESLAYVEACGFAKMHVFRYSERAGTPAAAAPGQVAAPTKAARAERLRALSARLEREHAASREGGPATLLVESVREGVAAGTTEDHLRVRARIPGARAGDLVPIVIGRSVDGRPGGYYREEEDARV